MTSRIVTIFALIMAGTLCVWGQALTGNEINGFPPNGVFSGSGFDSVQLNSGNLHIEIPIVSMNGRGLPVKLRMVYDNQGWTIATRTNKMTGISTGTVRFSGGSHAILQIEEPTSFWFGGGEPISKDKCGTSTVNAYRGFRMREPDGTKHHFVPDPYADTATALCPATTVFYADDGSGWMLKLNSGLQFTSKDGVSFRGPSLVTDSNGNQLTGIGDPIVITDTLGRSVPTDGTYTDSNGSLQAIQIANVDVPVQTNLCPLDPNFDDICNEYPDATVSVPQTITLPNGMQYSFVYEQNQYAEASSVTLPTGGQISWTWGPPHSPNGRWVASRTETQSGVNSTWNYAYTFSQSNPTTSYPHIATSTVTDPAGNDTKTTYVCTSFQNDVLQTLNGPCSESKIEVFQGSSSVPSNLRRTTDTVYQTISYPHNPQLLLPIRRQTTFSPENLVTKVETDWDTFTFLTNYTVAWRNPTEVREYAFGPTAPGPLVRRTHHDYLHLSGSLASQYRERNISDRSASTVVYDAGSTPVAQTTFSYDGTTVVSTSSAPAPGHDYANFGSSNNLRGNLTQVGKGLKVGASWTWLNTNNTYNDLGQIITSTDPGGHPTTYAYTDAWASITNPQCVTSANTYAFPATITDALNHRIKHSYYSCTSLIGSSQYENDIVAGRPGATYTYDLMNRRVATSLPDGGLITKGYIDSGTIGMTTTQRVTNTIDVENTTLLDGLGRSLQTQLRADPDCTAGSGLVKVDYEYGYDPVNHTRFTKVSTPYCDTPNSTYGLDTMTNYDALGRVISVVHTDGSTTTTSFGGTSTGLTATVTDEAGKQRKSQTDALGRLTAVWEDPGAAPHLNYETDYQYDVLGNLTRVDQKGGDPSSANWRTRTFAYNSLSQLLCVANPEIAIVTCPNPDNGSYTSGTIRYSYDNSGNVLTKTAPKPNQTGSAAVVTTYTYDALNRLTQKSYNDGFTATVQYGYDAVALTGCTTAPPALADSNPIGARTAMCDASGGTSWKHDEMGRVLQEKRKIGTVAAQSVFYTFNLDGSLKTLKYPSTAVVTYATGAAGRTLSVQDNGNSINYVQNAHYAPFGGLTSMTEGATPITTTNSYNKRLQPLTLSAATPTATILSLSYDFHLGAGDNGNVFQIVNNRVGNRTQNYLYDSLNRIQQAYSNGAGGNSWGETFGPVATDPGVPPATTGIDAWGNLTNRSGVNGKVNTELLNCPANNKNQLTGCSLGYDAAGNVTANDTASYTYDAENRLLTAGGVTYTYDGDGKRVKKSNGTLYWTGVGSNTLAESDLAGTTQKEYISFNGKRVARRDLPGTPSVKYYFSDQLGSASLITNAAGAMPPLEESDYYPYGGELIITNNDPNTYKFTGKERDAETGLDNFGARYFGNSLGRFMSPDPGQASGFDHMGDPQSWNGYAYARNNPLIYTDPDGLNYTVCDTNGKNCADLKNEQFQQYLKENPDVSVSASGQLSINIDGSSQNLGSATYYNEKDIQAAQMLVQTGATLGDPRTIGAFYGASAIVGGCAALCPAGASAALAWGRGVYYAAAGILPAVPSAIEKLQRLGITLSKASEIIKSPGTQKLIDNANNGNINYIADVGGKLVRITTDPTGQRIISAGYVQARNITNSIASGRFTPQ